MNYLRLKLLFFRTFRTSLTRIRFSTKFYESRSGYINQSGSTSLPFLGRLTRNPVTYNMPIKMLFVGKRPAAKPTGEPASKTAKPTTHTSSTTTKQFHNPEPEAGKQGTSNKIWLYLAEKWPEIDERPSFLQNPETCKDLDFKDIHYLLKNERMANKKTSGYERATKDVKPKLTNFIEGKDDRNENIHLASMLRTPICQPEQYWGLLPKQRKALFKSMPFRFLGGSNAIADKTILAAHDRTSPQLLKHFLSSNAGVQNRPKKEFKTVSSDGVAAVYDDWWEDVPNSLNCVQEAVNNYDLLMWLLWPQDPSSRIMLRLLTRYRWIAAAQPDMAKRIAVLTAFFNGVLAENANRAVNDEVILSFDEQETMLKDVLLRNGLRPEMPLLDKKPQDDQAAKPLYSSNRPVAGQKKPQGNAPRRSQTEQRTKSGLQICYHFNGPRRCTNQPTVMASGEKGCKDRRASYVHCCNTYMAAKGGLCENPNHGRHGHK